LLFRITKLAAKPDPHPPAVPATRDLRGLIQCHVMQKELIDGGLVR
jgi:hypothetical protein